MEKNKRIAYWDNVKFFTILLVVIGHFVLKYYDNSNTCKSIHLFIYAFHMPLFFFVSGIFYDRTKTKASFIYYMGCGLLLKIGFAVCDILLEEKVAFYLLYEGDIPWFMFAMGHYYLLMYLLDSVNRKYVLAISIILACISGYEQIGDYLVLSRTIVFFPFFILGTMFNKTAREKATAITQKYKSILFPLALLIIVIWGALCIFKADAVSVYLHLFKGRFAYSDAIVRYGPLARIACYIITVITGSSVLILCPKRHVKLITFMGSKTINVYFWHWILYRLLSKALYFEELFYSGPVG